MKKVWMWCLVIFLSGGLGAEVVDLKELARPDSIMVDDRDIVVTDGITIYVYGQKDRLLKKKLGGKAGEGPQEFLPSPAPWIPSVRVYLRPDQIFVSGMNKMVIFTRAGEYVTEFRPHSPRTQYFPVGKKYVVMGFARDKLIYVTYSLYDSNKKLEKELLRLKSLDQEGQKVDPLVAGMAKSFFFKPISDNRIFIASDDEAIHVFDENGQETALIKPPYPKIRLTSKDIEMFDAFFKKDIRFKDVYTYNREQVQFPDYYPLRKEYRVSKDKLYVITSKKVNNQFETFVYDFQGRLLQKVLLPLVEADPLEFYPFAFYNNCLYQVIESEDEELWQLHITPLK